MFRHWRRLGRSAVVIAAVVALLTAVGATPAHAIFFSWTLTDDFETNPAANWSVETDASGHAVFGMFDGVSHSGVQYAEIYRFVEGWNSIDRTVSLPWQSITSRRCTLAAFVQEWPGTRFNVEVIDPTGWTYLALGQFTLPSTFEWNQYPVSWTGGPGTVVLRFVVVSEGPHFARIKVDDMSLRCTIF